MQATRDQTVEFVADHSKELAEMAEHAGQKDLAYILRMAELEARNVLMPTEEKVKDAA